MSKKTAKKAKVIPQKPALVKSPSISRFITEWYNLAVGLSALLVLIMVAYGLLYIQKRQQLQKVQQERAGVQKEIRYWEEVAGKHSDYRDAYSKLAVLEYELGNIEKAKMYVATVLKLDPNFDKGRELEKLME